MEVPCTRTSAPPTPAKALVLFVALLSLIATVLPGSLVPAQANGAGLDVVVNYIPLSGGGATVEAAVIDSASSAPAAGLFADLQVYDADADADETRVRLAAASQVLGADAVIAVALSADQEDGLETLNVIVDVFEDDTRNVTILTYDIEFSLVESDDAPEDDEAATPDLPPLGTQVAWTPPAGDTQGSLDLAIVNLLDGSPAEGRFVDVQAYDTEATFGDDGSLPPLFIVSQTLPADGTLAIEVSADTLEGVDEMELFIDIFTSPTRNITAGFFYALVNTQEPASIGTPILTDVVGTTHEANIWRLVSGGITSGFPDGTFRPEQTVQRGQLATFMWQGLSLEPEAVAVDLSDIEGTTHEANIVAVVQSGVVRGFADGTYRPNATVTRGAMATFIANALRLPEAPSSGLSDIVGTTHEASIDRVVAAGIASGFGDGSFRPNAPVQRGQMATFLVKARDVQIASFN